MTGASAGMGAAAARAFADAGAAVALVDLDGHAVTDLADEFAAKRARALASVTWTLASSVARGCR